MVETDNTTEVLEVASIAGHILLENGAEISRVEDTMERIASHYGVDSGHFFVLSNGIFTTGSLGKYANVEFIPIRGIQLSKVVAVNKLSYEIAAGKHTLSEARQRLEAIKDAPAKPAWEQIAGSAFGAAGFCAVFGGGFMDCAADFVIGALLYVFCLFVSGSLSKIVGGICNALVATILCLTSYRLGFGDSLSNIIIGAVMPLIPGVPFVNGVRDLANSDYIAGLTRLTDAMLGFIWREYQLHSGRMGVRRNDQTQRNDRQSRDRRNPVAMPCRLHRHIRFRDPVRSTTQTVFHGGSDRSHRLGHLPDAYKVMPQRTDSRHHPCHYDSLHPFPLHRRQGQMPEHGLSAMRNISTRPWSRNILVHLLPRLKPVLPLRVRRIHRRQRRDRDSAWNNLRDGTAATTFLRKKERLILKLDIVRRQGLFLAEDDPLAHKEVKST